LVIREYLGERAVGGAERVPFRVHLSHTKIAGSVTNCAGAQIAARPGSRPAAAGADLRNCTYVRPLAPGFHVRSGLVAQPLRFYRVSARSCIKRDRLSHTR